MGGAELVLLLVAIAVSLLITAAAALVSVAVPLGVALLVWRAIASGRAVVVVPHALAPPKAQEGGLVLRATCRSCGAPRVTPSRSAYVYCDHCGELMAFDFQAAIADRRSKLPGPAYEALVREVTPQLERARRSGDKAAYVDLQARIFDAYARLCPAALSPRIGDEAYRRRFVRWTAEYQAEQDLDPACQETFARQQAAVGGLQWDRSDPFRPKARPETVWPMVDAVVAHQARCLDLADRLDLLASHPDRPSRDIVRRMGVSTLAQGWIPFLARDAQDELIRRLELGHDYARAEPVATRTGACAGCGAPITVVEGARRVVCHACGRMAAVSGGTLPCHGCGAPVELPVDTNLFQCPSCSAELRAMRW